ncbi:MAG: leucine-rich repeat protein [Lachnospiraceae bacterium]|nr:leucine-rich repeat protein [Lachnospiraceae bacterium]
MAKKKSSKKRFRLKKSVRRTIAALLLVTAVIIAAVPVKNVEATIDPHTAGIPSLDDIIADPDYTSTTDTSVLPDASGASVKAFPLLGTYTTQTGKKSYYEISTAGMDNVNQPVPIFIMKERSGELGYGCLEKYVGHGGSGFTPVGGSVDLNADVCYMSTNPYVPETIYENTYSKYEKKEYIETKLDLSSSIPEVGNYEIIKLTVNTYTRTDDDIERNPDGTPVLDSEGKEIPTWPSELIGVPDAQETHFVCDQIQTVYSMADYSFQGASNISTMTIPDKITAVGDYAFEGCSYLESAAIGVNCKSIGRMAFANCQNLSSINMQTPTALQTISDGAFANTSISSVRFPNTVNELGSALFYGCKNLNDTIGGYDSHTSGMFVDMDTVNMKIGSYVFAGCEGLTEIKLYKHINNMGSADATFAGCTSLERVQLPEDFTSGTLSSGNFYLCPSLNYVRFYGASDDATDSEFITSTNEDMAIHAGAAPNRGVPDTFAIWGEIPNPNVKPATHKAYAYARRNGNTYMYVDADGKTCYELTLYGYRFQFSSDGKILSCERTDDAEDLLRIPSTIGGIEITSTDASAFISLRNGTKPKYVYIPDSITSIGDNAFNDVDSIEEMYIDTQGTAIGNSAFYGCNNLAYVQIFQTDGTTGGTSIGDNCFAQCPNLAVINLRDDNYTSDSIRDANITSIGENAFKTGRSSYLDNSIISQYMDAADTTNKTFLIMKGDMSESYLPYLKAIDSAYTVSPTYNSYITYCSGNPQNLSARYSAETGNVELLTYPTRNTIVDKVTTYPTNYPYAPEIAPTGSKTISDVMIDKEGGALISTNENNIIEGAKHVTIPYGVNSIDKAVNSTTFDQFIVNANGPAAVPADREGDGRGLTTLTLTSVHEIPDQGISEDYDLQTVIFTDDIKDLGDKVFLGDLKLTNVLFQGEGDKASATPDDPFYWCENYLIFAYDGTDTTLVQCLQSRGADGNNYNVNAAEVADVTKILPGAFEDCDYIRSVDFSKSEDLKVIPKDCFLNCDDLEKVYLPESVNQIDNYAFSNCPELEDVFLYAVELDISDNAFSGDPDFVVLHSYEDSAAERYAKRISNVTFEPLTNVYTVTFLDYDGTVISQQKVEYEKNAQKPADPVRLGYKFTGWNPDEGWLSVKSDITVVAQYVPEGYTSSSSGSTGRSTSSSGRTSSSGGGGGGGGSSSGSSSRSSSASSSSRSSSSANSSTMNSSTTPVVVSGIAAGYVPPAGGAAGTSGTGNTGGGGNIRGNGRTSVVSTTPGISDTGKMSATVNGSSDNYILKITHTDEADELARQALMNRYGSLDNIRYLPMDISLYDGTGTTKISPIPAGASVNVSTPIPDDLAIYGGNAKVASTIGGVLEDINPRFSVVTGTPMMTFTATHLSPYVIYVDTANLGDVGMMDNTPQTGDMIHPKWFLVIGLVAASIFMFLKRDERDKVQVAA